MGIFVQGGIPAAAGDKSFETGVIEAMAEWCDALQGGMSLEDAFAALAAGFGAEAGVLVRTNLGDFRPARVATWDRRACGTIAPLCQSFADGFFGRPLSRPRASTLWVASVHEEDPAESADPALEAWQEKRDLKDFATLVLNGGPPVRDHIELHFAKQMPASLQGAIAAVLPTMARTWASRRVGLISRAVDTHRESSKAPAGKPRRPLLDIANPAHLSRAEFRVCLLLSRGLSVLGVAEELSVSESTVRTHLRNIYAKTDTSNLAELVFRLISAPPEDDGADLRCA